jgi:hypothetical protein
MPGPRTVNLAATYAGKEKAEWLLKSFGTSIPGILQTCSESRYLALEMLTPALKPDLAGAAGFVTYINFDLDTIALSFVDSLSMTETDDLSIVESREKVRGVICYIETCGLTEGVENWISAFVFHSMIDKWSEVQTWSFPGIAKEDSTRVRITDWVCFEFRRPTSAKMAERYTRSATRRVKRAVQNVRPNSTSDSLTGLRIIFTQNPSPGWFARGPANTVSLEW